MTRRPTVADAMVKFPKICAATTTVEQAYTFFNDDHVHALLVVDGEVLDAVVHREDLTDRMSPSSLVARAGTLEGRVISPDADLEAVRDWMLAHGRRRLTVVDARQRLVGLLCTKKSRRGFCSDADIASRACGPRA